MPLTAQDVHDKLFTSVRFAKGYDEDEVDAFLDEVEAEITRLTAENDDLRRQLEIARSGAPVPPAPVPTPAPVAAPLVVAEPPAMVPAAGPAAVPPASETEDMLRRTLLLAQRTADEAIAEARAEAAKTLAAAREQAAAVEREAMERRTSLTTELESHKRALELSVEQLRGFEREYRTRLRAYREMQLRDLERHPGAAPAAPGGSTARPVGSSSHAAPALPPSAPPPPPPPPAEIATASAAAARPFRPSPFTSASPVLAPPAEAHDGRAPSSLQPPAPEPGDLDG
jgi:DivIVA domain-containing protein